MIEDNRRVRNGNILKHDFDRVREIGFDPKETGRNVKKDFTVLRRFRGPLNPNQNGSSLIKRPSASLGTNRLGFESLVQSKSDTIPKRLEIELRGQPENRVSKDKKGSREHAQMVLVSRLSSPYGWLEAAGSIV